MNAKLSYQQIVDKYEIDKSTVEKIFEKGGDRGSWFQYFRNLSKEIVDGEDTDDDAGEEETAFITVSEGEKAFNTLKNYLEQRDVDYQNIRIT